MRGGLNADVPEAAFSFLAGKSGVGESKVEDVAACIAKICTESNAFPAGSSIIIPECTTEPL